MNTTVVVVAVVVVIAILAIVAWLYTRQRRRGEVLREQFGPEYDRAVATYGQREEAEKALEARTERVAALHIRDMSRADSQKYAEEWRSVQSRLSTIPNTPLATPTTSAAKSCRPAATRWETSNNVPPTSLWIIRPSWNTTAPRTRSRSVPTAAIPPQKSYGRRWSITARCSKT
jgi:FtsZ-interacting cell division protein ZipA